MDLYVRTYQDTYDLGPVKVSEMATTGREVTSNRGRLENIDGSTAGHANLDKVEIYSSDGHTYYLRFKHINGNYYHIGTNASSNTIEDGGSGFGGYHYRRHSAYVGFVETPSGQENNMNGMNFIIKQLLKLMVVQPFILCGPIIYILLLMIGIVAVS